ncbi:MAG TPA: hypothetical protein DCY13_04395 [Verrucomicrobiales bacterium]|nr:hypothetical protein [Verrucomicrobiales bacterium]
MNEFHYVDREGRQQGPVQESEIHRLRQEGVIGHESPIWRTGWTNWRIYSAAFPQGGSPPPLPRSRPRVFSRVAGLTGWLLVLVGLGAALPIAFALVDGFVFLTASSDHVERDLLRELLPWGLTSAAGLTVVVALMARRKLPAVPAILCLMLNLGSLGLLFVTVAMNRASEFKSDVIASISQGDFVEIDPLDSDGRATGPEREAIQDAWYRRHMLTAWLERTPTNAPGYARHREVIELSVRRAESSLSVDEWDRFNLLYRDYVSVEKLDAHAILACMDLDLPWTTRAELLSAADELFDRQAGNHALRFLCAKLLGESRAKAGPGHGSVDEADDETLEQLRLAIEAGAYGPDEWIALSFHIASIGADGLLERRGPDLIKALGENPSVPEWLTERWKGAWEIKQAWKARGGGFANSVSDRGWDLFLEHSARAEVHLQRSWELEPSLPFAAQEMVYVQLGIGGYEEMRLWFDRTIAADFDYGGAYGRLLWGLRPRWHGSHQSMLEFGRVCAATKRFDTAVPWRMHEAVHDVISETKQHAALLRRQDVYQDLIGVYSGYADIAADEPERRRRHLSWKLATAVFGAHWDDAERFLEEVGAVPSMEVCRQFELNPQDLALAAIGRGDSVNHPAFQAVLHLGNQRFAEASAALREAQLLTAPNRPVFRRWLEILAHQVGVQQQLADGSPIAITDGELDVAWEQFPADARMVSANHIELSAHSDYQDLLSRFDLGSEVVIEGSFSIEPPEADFELHLKYGNFYQFQSAWRTVRFRRYRDEPMIGLSRGLLQPTHTGKTEFEEENRFTIVLTPVGGSVVLNGSEVIDAEGLRDNLLRSGKKQFGITFGSSPEQAKITLKDVTLRRP